MQASNDTACDADLLACFASLLGGRRVVARVSCAEGHFLRGGSFGANEDSQSLTTMDEMLEQRDFVNKYNLRIGTNLRRVEDLITFADNRFPKDRSSQIKDDILRAAVVLLHATLEDFLRFLGGRYIPSGGEEVLNRMSLVDSSSVLHPEKFLLGKLAEHRGKTVDQLIAESVQAHLDKRSFSSIKDITSLLASVGIPSSEVEKYYPTLNDLIVRRHEIVHRGDLIPSEREQSEREVQPIEATKVEKWYDTVYDFMTEVATYKLTAGV